jgi:hypothetical protein
VLHDFDKSGSFGTESVRNKFIEDKKLESYLNKEDKLEMDSEGRLLKRTSDGKLFRQELNESGELVDT